MATVYVIRHRGSDGQTYTRDAHREREARLVEGLHHAGHYLQDRAKPYERQSVEVKGIARRLERIRDGREKVK